MLVVLNGTSMYRLDNNAPYNLPEGTHYVVVYSQDGSYSANSQYTVKLVSKENTGLIPLVSSGTNVFSISQSGDYYVNGNLIDFRWSYATSVDNSAGYINMYMNLYKGTNQFVPLVESDLADINRDGDLPFFVDYSTTFEGGKPCSPALILTLINTGFRVNRYAGGAYARATAFTLKYKILCL